MGGGSGSGFREQETGGRVDGFWCGLGVDLLFSGDKELRDDWLYHFGDQRPGAGCVVLR